MVEYLVLYNSKRPHKSLELMTPVDYILRESKIAICGGPIHLLSTQSRSVTIGAKQRCQQRVKSDPLTATTNGLILIHLVYSGLASAITPAFRFCFSR
jgi:hypothetical protein